MAQRAMGGGKGEEISVPDIGAFVKAGEKQIAALGEAQLRILGTLSTMNRRWISRAAMEARLWTELGSKLSAARSVPEFAAAYQEWIAARTNGLVEDGRQFIADCEEATRMLSSGLTVPSS
jgi:hypothetical protein